MTDHLFVYGTLREESAHPMAHRLRVGARHIGRGSTPGRLFDFGSWPGAFFAPEVKYRVIGLEEEQTVHYDHLVFALGSVTRIPDNIPGLREFGFEMKALVDAIALRDRGIRLLPRYAPADRVRAGPRYG